MPRPNSFVIDGSKAYAMTDLKIAEIAEFLMTRLVPVNYQTLRGNNRKCAICQEEFGPRHTSVKTPCGHYFGKLCLVRWLDPLYYWGLKEEEDNNHSPKGGHVDCPLCRRVFFRKSSMEPMRFLQRRLQFWDTAYATVGVSRSQKEERTRKYLWQYVRYCKSIDQQEIDDTMEFKFDMDAQKTLLDFALDLTYVHLTTEQEHLRRKLERIGRKDLWDVTEARDGSYIFKVW